jgi:dihydrodiol dehydrogenase / D-xylose 1-dehydrogenase (NADP)
MKTRQNLKWGIMGPGLVARTLADALKIHPDCQLQAVASKTISKAESFAKKYGAEHALSYQELAENEEIDIIYVATTHNFHYENAKLALEHGKHVVIEKPFTVNANEAKELVQIAKRNNLFLMEAIWVRFLPSLKLLKARLQDGTIGEPKLFDISVGGFVGAEYRERLTNPALAGGATLDLGIYPISFVCFMLGEIPSEIKSMTRFSESGVDEISCYQFRFPSGCFATIKVSYNLKMKNDSYIYGSKGQIKFPDSLSGESFTISKHDGTNEISETMEIEEKNSDNGFIYQVEEVVHCLQEGKMESEIIPLSESIAIMEVMDKMRAEWGFKYPFE